ncbi:MAG: DJ-1/PfpI family protein [Clostridiales bacterium]|nr:DJ-1/PfpI family protein [Clostridiales bacterium]
MIYEFLADGFEEIEALETADILRRASVDVVLVGVGSKNVTGSHGITVVCDRTADEVSEMDKPDGVILPGGMPGTLNLERSDDVKSILDYAVKSGKLICAICAAPSVLGHRNILNGKKATCFPGFEDDLYGAEVTGKQVVTDGNIITAKGAGAASDFGFAIVEYFKGKKCADELKRSMQYK